MRKRIGILRVITTVDEKILLSHQRIIQKILPEYDFETKCIMDQYNGIYDEDSYNLAFPKIVNLVEEWQSAIDGLIISCAGDPGVEYLRNKLSIPVVGAGIATACISLNYGTKIGIIGIEKYPPTAYEEILGNRILGYEVPEGVINTNDLQTEIGKRSIIQAAIKLKSVGCDVIAFACTGLSTAGAANIIRDIDLPVVDAVIAEAMMMKFMIVEHDRKGGFAID